MTNTGVCIVPSSLLPLQGNLPHALWDTQGLLKPLVSRVDGQAFLYSAADGEVVSQLLTPLRACLGFQFFLLNPLSPVHRSQGLGRKWWTAQLFFSR
jgi:hypothetical protein